MRKHLVNELDVAILADTLWAIYSTTQFPKLIVQLLPTVVQNIEIDGDGSIGTVLTVTFVPGSVPLSYKEKIVTINHEKRLKEVVQIEGGYLDLGCSFYMSSFHILEKGCDSSIIKSMVTYELAKDADPSVADLVTIAAHAAIAQVISKYVHDKQGAAAPGRDRVIKMRKHVVDELEVAVPADTLWAIHSTLQFPKLIVQLLPTIVQNIEIDGDGSIGTVLTVTFVQGTVPSSYKEKFVTIDHEKRLKEVVHIEGGYLDMGCSFYMSSFQILEKGCDSCIIKSMVTYELAKDTDPSVDDMVNNITVLAAVAKAMSKYVLDKQNEAASAP